MGNAAIFIGIIPLLAFVIIDSFMGLKSALIAAIILAIAEGAFSYFYLGELDSVTLASVFFVVLLAFVSYRKNSETWLLFQPVILSVGLGLYLIVAYFFGHPIMYEMMEKYQNVMPEKVKYMLSNPMFVEILKLFSIVGGIAFILHGAVTALAALKLNKWWWIAVRGVGFYAFMILAIIVTQYLVIAG